MTQLEILKYAYHGALEAWCKAKDKAEEMPNNKTRQARLDSADKAFNEIRNLLIEEEQKNSVA